jgi:competence protein ComEA
MKKIIAAIAIALCMAASSASAIDVNTATAEELDASPLMRMGKVTSMKTVAERDLNGPFKDANDLMTRVPGIGKMFITNNAAELQFSNVETAPKVTPAATTTAPAATATPAAQ